MSSVVFIGAHPDDVELGAGGTCARLAREGHDVHIILMTDEADAACRRRRRVEAVRGAKVLGVPKRKVHFLGLPDGNVRCGRETVHAMRVLLREKALAPVAVFAHSEADSHNDHVETSRIVRASFRKTAILSYQVVNSAMPTGFHPRIFVGVDDVLPRKLEAVRAHVTQGKLGRLMFASLEALDRRYAGMVDGRFCEAFAVDVQEGCGAGQAFIDALNDGVLERFWGPVIGAGGVTIVAGLGGAADWLKASASRAHGLAEFAAVTKLQSDLYAIPSVGFPVAAGYGIRAVIADAVQPDTRRSEAFGSTVIVGSPVSNPAAEAMLAALPEARFRLLRDRRAESGTVLNDRSTSALLRANPAGRGRGSKGLDADVGLVTLAIHPGVFAHEGPRFLVGAMGLTPAGTLAAAACLTDRAWLARHIATARALMSGRIAVAQWLVHADGSDVDLELVETHAGAGRAQAADGLDAFAVERQTPAAMH